VGPKKSKADAFQVSTVTGAAGGRKKEISTSPYCLSKLLIVNIPSLPTPCSPTPKKIPFCKPYKRLLGHSSTGSQKLQLLGSH
jgi:hypothetical protein